MSAAELSKLVAEADNYITNIENRRRWPSFPKWFAICEALDISPKDFFDEECIGDSLQKCDLHGRLMLLDSDIASHISAIVDAIIKAC